MTLDVWQAEHFCLLISTELDLKAPTSSLTAFLNLPLPSSCYPITHASNNRRTLKPIKREQTKPLNRDSSSSELDLTIRISLHFHTLIFQNKKISHSYTFHNLHLVLPCHTLSLDQIDLPLAPQDTSSPQMSHTVTRHPAATFTLWLFLTMWSSFSKNMCIIL